MNKFWPRRPSPEGFSIKKLARRCRQKLSKNSFDGLEKLVNDEKFSKNTVKLFNRLKGEMISPSSGCLHWANRDFYEYQDAA